MYTVCVNSLWHVYLFLFYHTMCSDLCLYINCKREYRELEFGDSLVVKGFDL